MDNWSAMAIGPSALRKVGWMSSGLRMTCMAVSSSRTVKGEQMDSVAVGICSIFFRCLAWECSVLLKKGVGVSVVRQKHAAIVDSQKAVEGDWTPRGIWLGSKIWPGRLEILPTLSFWPPPKAYLLHHMPQDIPLGLTAPESGSAAVTQFDGVSQS